MISVDDGLAFLFILEISKRFLKISFRNNFINEYSINFSYKKNKKLFEI